MATHSSVLAWRIPGTGEPGRLPSMGSHRVGHDWSDLAVAAGVPSTSYCLVGSQFTSTRAEPKGKASDGAGRSQCVFLVKCKCDCISLFWKDLVMYVICITPFLLLPGMMSLVEILLFHGWLSSWNWMITSTSWNFMVSFLLQGSHVYVNLLNIYRVVALW